MADLQYRLVGWRLFLESTGKHQSHVSVVFLVELCIAYQHRLPICVCYWILIIHPLIIFPIQLLFLSQRLRLWHRSSWTVVILSNRLVERLHNFWLRWMVKCQYWIHLSAIDKQYQRNQPRLSSLDPEGKRGNPRLSLYWMCSCKMKVGTDVCLCAIILNDIYINIGPLVQGCQRN